MGLQDQQLPCALKYSTQAVFKKQNFKTPKIINLSKQNLTNSEISLLEKGLKFCPTPEKPNYLDLEIDVKEFIRKIELAVFMFGKDSYNDDCLVSKKSDFIPPDNLEPLFQSSLYQLKGIAENLKSYETSHHFSNITAEERKAIKNLSQNENIVIKKADKGNNVVIMDKEYYINKISECLNNFDVYKKLPKNIDSKVMGKIKSLMDKYKTCFDKKGKEIEYITDFEYKTANFYGLPKVHKSKILIEKIESTQNNKNYIEIKDQLDLSFRYITGGPVAPTSNLSEFLDILLKPYLSNIKSHVKDTTDFLNKLPISIRDDPNVTILTCDVRDMYNSISLDLGLEAIQYWLFMFPNLLPPRINTFFVLEALELVLKNSNFEFLDEMYCLEKGTVTGTKVAPTYATLVMAFLETELYYQVEKNFGIEVKKYVESNWLRFLDDGFIIWKKSFGNHAKFVDILNNLDPNIIFTHEASDQGLSYLNVFVYVEDNKIKTDMYYKETDAHEYLPFSSNHPRHTKTAIPFNLARSICTIVSDPERKKLRLEELKVWLLKSGYPFGIVKNSFKKVSSMRQVDLRKQTVKNDDDKSLVYVETFNPKNPKIFEKIKEVISFLSHSSTYKNIFENLNFIKSDRQPKNLGQLLQSSRISNAPINKGSRICGKSNCGTCFYLGEGKTVKFKGLDNFFLNFSFSCDVSNIIYKITCNGCQEYYIGMTKSLRNRVTHHKFCLNNEQYRTQRVYIHIHNCAGHLEKPFSITPFYKCKNNTVVTRLATESYFIRKFQPSLNGD